MKVELPVKRRVPLFKKVGAGVRISLVTAHVYRRQIRAGICRSENKMARAEFQEYWSSCNIVLLRDQGGDRRNQSGMLLERKLHPVRRGGHIHVCTKPFAGGLNQAKKALLSFACARGIEHSPVAFFIVEVRIN